MRFFKERKVELRVTPVEEKSAQKRDDRACEHCGGGTPKYDIEQIGKSLIQTYFVFKMADRVVAKIVS